MIKSNAYLPRTNPDTAAEQIQRLDLFRSCAGYGSVPDTAANQNLIIY